MKNASDRRRSPRVSSSFPLRYRLIPVSGSGYVEGRVEDLSADGVRFLVPGDVRARSGFLFEMLVPGAKPVRTFGRAAWVRELPDRSGFEVGSSFVDQSTAARKAIERHLHREPVPAAG
jgi:hypothetical protein